MPIRLPFRVPALSLVVLTGAAVVLVTVAPVAAAADATAEIAKLPGLVVTGSRSPIPITESLADLTVIDRDEIERAGPGGIVAMLQRQPGVEISRTGGAASVSGVFIRGANRGHTLVLVDGVRIGSISDGAAALQAIPPGAVDRIEILRGPASALYGADAIGGVVQIFTRRGEDVPAMSLQAGYGSHDTRELSASASGRVGPARLSVTGVHRSSSGFNAIDRPSDFSFNPDRDGFSGDSGAVSLAVPYGEGQELSASYLRTRLNGQYDGGPGFDDRTISLVEARRIETRNRIRSGWDSRLAAAESVDDSLSRTGFGDFPFRSAQRQYSWLNDFALPAGNLTAGFERREERLATNQGFATTGRDTDALVGIYRWHDAQQAVQANLRRDDSNQYGTRTTGGLTYAYRVLPALRLSAGYSSAFKAPTFNDLYYPGFSNPHLRPEVSHNVEIGAAADGRLPLGAHALNWEARASVYRNRVHDLIVFQCDAQFNCAPQNVDDAVLEGITLAIDARRDGMTINASLDLQDPHDRRTGALLPRRARQHGSVAVAQRWGDWRFGAELAAASRRYDNAANTIPLAGYGLLNLTIERDLGQGWSALLRGDNVLDRDYRIASQYASGGSMIFLAIRWQR